MILIRLCWKLVLEKRSRKVLASYEIMAIFGLMRQRKATALRRDFTISEPFI